jgi:hypothetical protein
MGLFDTIAIQGQMAQIQTELAATLPGTPQYLLLEQQLAVLENEAAETPIVPPIFGGLGFGPRPGWGPGGFGGFGGRPGWPGRP